MTFQQKVDLWPGFDPSLFNSENSDGSDDNNTIANSDDGEGDHDDDNLEGALDASLLSEVDISRI